MTKILIEIDTDTQRVDSLGRRIKNDAQSNSVKAVINRTANELIGHRFGRLTVVSYNGSKRNNSMWNCKCECGNNHVVSTTNLKLGSIKSCGCFAREGISKRSITHGFNIDRVRPREYRAWAHIIGRCHNESDASYKNYGGRGIFVCDRWRDSFSAFMSDMGECPDKHSIERIDNDGPYSPDNCKWATVAEQMRNTRRTVRLTYQGETLCQADWDRKLGQKSGFVAYKIKSGLTIDQIVRLVEKKNEHS